MPVFFGLRYFFSKSALSGIMARYFVSVSFLRAGFDVLIQ